METIIIDDNKRLALTKELFTSVQNDLNELRNVIFRLFVTSGLNQDSKIILYGCDIHNSSVNSGYMIIDNELLPFVFSQNVGNVLIDETTVQVNGVDSKGNQYSTIIKKREAKMSIVGTIPLSSFTRINIATLQAGKTVIEIDEQLVEQPFSTTSSNVYRDQFNQLNLDLGFNATTQNWEGWHNILTLPANLRPADDILINATIVLSSQYYKVVPLKIANTGVVSIYFYETTAGSLHVRVISKY